MSTPDPRIAARRIAHLIDRELGPGDVAALRRLTTEDPGCPAFWRLSATVLAPGGLLPESEGLREWTEARWAVVAQAAASMRGLRSEAGLGRALAEAGYSEMRFTRLLRADDAPLFDEVRTAARYLASKGTSVDPADFADLLLRPGHAAERVRRRIARAYYDHATQS